MRAKRSTCGELGGVSRSCLRRQLFEQHHRLLLHGRTLGVLERHIEEDALDRRKKLVGTEPQARDGEIERLHVMAERLGRTAKDIAAKLIEQNDQRQPAAGRALPAFELALGGELNVMEKAVSEPFVPSLDAVRRILVAPEPISESSPHVLGVRDDVGKPDFEYLPMAIHGERVAQAPRVRCVIQL